MVMESQPSLNKSEPVGLVNVLSPNKLVFPNYSGSGMFYSMGNASETHKIGMLSIDMETPLRIQVQGTVTISKNDELIALFPGSNMLVEMDITSVFYNCARYIHKHKRLENSKYVPDANGEQPFPAWKRIDKLREVLQPRDIGIAENEGGTITNEKYDQKVRDGES